MVGWIVDVGPEKLELDMRVEVVVDDVAPDVTLPRFRRPG